MEHILQEAVDIIVKNFAPDKVILFGSRQWGRRIWLVIMIYVS